jgi:ornithine carbamoyltransferase
MIYGCALSDVKLSIATPKGFEPDKTVVEESKKFIDIDLTTDPLIAIKNADVVVTDTYTSIHNKDPKRIKKFLPKYQINQTLMNKAEKDAIFMHCLPAKRENEVTSSVIDGHQSVVWDEAENRLHTQKALLASIIRA